MGLAKTGQFHIRRNQEKRIVMEQRKRNAQIRCGWELNEAKFRATVSEYGFLLSRGLPKQFQPQSAINKGIQAYATLNHLN